MFIKEIWFFKRINGIVLWPFLFVQNKDFCDDLTFMNHERIHAKLQLELLLIPFFFWYIIEYALLRLKYNRDRAYRNIVFEREAYAMEENLNYLKSRKMWSFMRFYGKKYRL